MTRMNLANYLFVLPLLLADVGCSDERLIDLGGTAGNGNSAGAAGAPNSGGAASSGNPGLPPMISEMVIQLDGTEYGYSCPNAPVASVGEDWRGPIISSGAHGHCPWPHPKPTLRLSVLFTDFLPSEGLAPRTYDLAEQVEQTVAVGFSTQSQGEVLVGQTIPYAIYASRPTELFEVGPPMLPAVGTSGTVTVTSYGPVMEPVGGANCDVSLSNVVLPLITNTGGDFPSTVTIKSARFLHRWDF
jgi:hypothetical protein